MRNAIGLAMMIAFFTQPLWAETFLVTNAQEEGEGSLRQAITQANISPGFDSIIFRIAHFQPIVISRQELPVITGPTLIDGWSQNGEETVNVEITLTERLPYVLSFAAGADGSEVRGLALNSSGGSGIQLRHVSKIFIHGNYIGTDLEARHAKGNKAFGIDARDVDNLSITHNVISANHEGGIFLRNTLAPVGVVPAFDRVLISNNIIGLSQEKSWLGDPETDALQTHGIMIDQASQITIANNTIGGNHNNGIQLGSMVQQLKIIANSVGFKNDEQYYPNGENGISTAASDVWIGDSEQEGNVIAYNFKNGISVAENSRNVNILTNLIFGNKALPIDLNANGPTLNDRADTDAGANALLNYPNLVSATLDGSRLNVVLHLDIDSASGLVQFFSNPVPLPNVSHGEHQIFLGQTDVSRASGDQQIVSIELPKDFDFPHLDQLSATTTVQGAFGPGTSEMSPTIPIIRPIDFGDAPTPWPQAYHIFYGPLYLGKCADADSEFVQNVTADADDQTEGAPIVGACAIRGDDDDGVIFPQPIIAGTVNTMLINNKGDGVLAVWIDYNNDGDFDDHGENVLRINANEGKRSVDIFVPSDVFGRRYLRARIIPYDQPVASKGGIIGGEVEDQQLSIYPSDALEKAEKFNQREH